MKKNLFLAFVLAFVVLSSELWADIDIHKKTFAERILDFFKNAHPRGLLSDFEGFPVDMGLPVLPFNMKHDNMDLFIGNAKDSANGLYNFLAEIENSPPMPLGLTASDTTSPFAYWGWSRVPLHP
jgi:hypothetical protein